MDTLEITYTSDGAVAAGVDRNSANPLARALNSLLSTGKPFERFSACYLDPLPLDKGLRWFGTFVISAARRVIYFPGLAAMQQHTFTSKGRGHVRHHALEVDHLTLEAGRGEWHLTGIGAKPHLGKFPTTDLGEPEKLAGHFVVFWLT